MHVPFPSLYSFYIYYYYICGLQKQKQDNETNNSGIEFLYIIVKIWNRSRKQPYERVEFCVSSGLLLQFEHSQMNKYH